MNFIAKILLAVCFLGVLPAGAQEVGTGLVCNTQKQVEQYVAAFGETHSGEQSLFRVNSLYEGEKNVCAVSPVAFERKKTVNTISGYGGTYDIVEILVVGIPVGRIAGEVVVNGFAKPETQYTLFRVKGFDI